MEYIIVMDHNNRGHYTAYDDNGFLLTFSSYEDAKIEAERMKESEQSQYAIYALCNDQRNHFNMSELTPEDKQRIEQAAKLSWKNTITAFEDSDEISFWEGYLTGAEYATLYERQQQAELKELNRTLYESNERQAVVISEFKQEGSSERARANNAVGKYWEKLQQIEKLEAERSELRNKVIEEAIELMTKAAEIESDPIFILCYSSVIGKLNSLKTK